MNTPRKKLLRLASLAGLAALTLGLSGCPPQLAAIFGQDEPVPAEYKLTKAPLLVLVEEFANSGGDPTIRYYLVDQLDKELKDKDHPVNKQVVPQRTVQDYLANHPMTAERSAARIGRELHAQQVLYVQIEPYNSNSEMRDLTNAAQMAASVHVIDAEKGEQLWPDERAGHKVVYTMPMSDMQAATPGTEQLKKDLARGLATEIGRLFYKHQPREGEAVRREAAEHSPPW